jgi:hypothetical protein
MTTRNETTEHVHRFRQTGQPWPHDLECECRVTLAQANAEGGLPFEDRVTAYRSEMQDALAAERRATVERIRERLFAYYKASDSGAAQHPGIFTILDEEGS